ncbi:MAG: NAD(P)-dependent oxidoreductase [Erysipelotrichaceae bacterium]
MRAKVAILEPLGISNEQLKQIIDGYNIEADFIYYDDKPADKQQLIARCQDCQAIVTAQIPLDREVIDACINLKYICIAFTGYDHVDVLYAQKKGIVVSNCSGYSTGSVSELVIALAISLLRKIKENDLAVRNGQDKTGLVGSQLEGKTFGIVGLGAIGQKVAELAKAFGCKVIGYSRTKKQIDNVEFVDSLEELLKRSDIVSLHVPANASTKALIAAEQLKMMKKTAVLINCARGSVVDNQALTNALNTGEITAAAVDVFDYEPPLSSDYCLLKAKNCLLTAHIGFASQQAFEKRAHIVADNIQSYFQGNTKNVVNGL